MTLEFSTDTPCVANVIPAMDRMHADLLAACNNKKYSTAIRAALKIGMNLLNKYYSITDNSEVYRIAMGMSNIIPTCDRLTNLLIIVLHPKHKMKYFKKQGWDKKWIETAEVIVREEFKRNYAAYVIPIRKNAQQPAKKVCPILCKSN